jgi:hypothetical protein
MSKNRIKLAIFLAAVPVALLVLLLIFRALGGLIALFNTGANPASIFRGAELTLPQAGQARWIPDTGDTGNTMSDAQREAVLAAYWGGWAALARAYKTGLRTDLATYWAGGAYDGLDLSGSGESAGHKLRLRYFSDDGTVAALDDVGFTLDPALEIYASASVVMTLDSGYWRIRSITIQFVKN